MAKNRKMVRPDKGPGYLSAIGRFFVRHFARIEGFLDPILLLSHLSRFAQPSELTAPKELLRAGAIMQARGLINSQAIQHNMDWIWPYWVDRQFDPHDESFIPRAFNLTHLNLTHRNWTAVGVPDSNDLPIVDPRGLVTPFYDGWSLDHWLLPAKGNPLIPSQQKNTSQEFVLIGNPAVKTRNEEDGMILKSSVEAYMDGEITVCKIRFSALSPSGGWLAVSLRPYNPEGICFIDKIAVLKDSPGWKVNGHEYVYSDAVPERTHFSNYWKGDVFGQLSLQDQTDEIECKVGMATSAALFKLKPNEEREVTFFVPLKKDFNQKPADHSAAAPVKWEENLKGLCRLEIPDKHFQFLYDAAIRSLILHSPLDVYPGPYTYKRFWFRDAAFILEAMLAAGMSGRAEKVIDRFHLRQSLNGYFLSQDGEWDSNGEALWIMRRFCRLTGQKPKTEWQHSIYSAAKWIQKKRTAKDGKIGAGLLPVGFSAEHLGPNDFYYWDDFWGVAGLKAGAYFAKQFGDDKFASELKREAEDFLECIHKSLEQTDIQTRGHHMPASPHRRMDAGAIGSIVAGYPLQVFAADDTRLMNTAQYLFENCFYKGGFYQEMSHSGVNPYLTLHLAQVFLRAGDPRYFDLMSTIAGLASPTGQWPEAVHPRTNGGCMGDGQHIWAASEWILMIRNCFIFEEESKGKLVFGAGIPPAWLSANTEMTFGPAPTRWGPVSLKINVTDVKIRIEWQAEWFSAQAPPIEIRLKNFARVTAAPGEKFIELLRNKTA